jgi:FGGY-family pentulose kinase
MAAPSGPFVLGIDAGSQSVRSGVFSLDGALLGAATHPCETLYPRVSWAEQNAEEWWKAVRITVPAALAQAGLRGEDLAALSVDATSCTVVCCRRDGTVLRPAIMWMDQRAFAEARRLNLTQDPVLQYVSGHESPEWMIPKALWLKANEPQVYEAAELIIEATDWLTFRLTGEWTASRCNATAKWNYARPAGGYPTSLLAAVDASELLDKWPPEVLALGAPAGEISARAAAELGLKAGTPVARGGIDAYAATLGSGVVEPGRMALVLGSSTCHMALSDRPIFGAHVWGPYPDALLEGAWILEGGQTATGSILSWLAENFAGREKIAEARGDNRYTVLDAAAAEIAPGAEGLVVLDYWQGNRTPLRDPLARGAIWGLSLRHTLPHVWRAVLEGTAMGSRHIIEDLAEAGFHVAGLYACGGGARSELWLQIHADVTGIPLYLPALTHEASLLGTAICAAVGAGLFPDLKTAAEAMVHLVRQIDPNPEHHSVYLDLYRHYLATYPALRDLMHEVAREE